MKAVCYLYVISFTQLTPPVRTAAGIEKITAKAVDAAKTILRDATKHVNAPLTVRVASCDLKLGSGVTSQTKGSVRVYI